MLREWDYGEYEGLTMMDIQEREGNDEWNIWRDGCPKGEYVSLSLVFFLQFLLFCFRSFNSSVHSFQRGETNRRYRSPQQVTERIDSLLAEIKQRILTTATSWPGGNIVAHATGEARDIVCIGNGHILSAMALRWTGQPLGNGMRLLIEPASVAVLGYVVPSRLTGFLGFCLGLWADWDAGSSTIILRSRLFCLVGGRCTNIYVVVG